MHNQLFKDKAYVCIENSLCPSPKEREVIECSIAWRSPCSYVWLKQKQHENGPAAMDV